MEILILFAFLAGIVTILSPCILPVLPIILSGSVTESKKYPYGVILGFIVSFTFFTIFLSTIVKITGISGDFVRNFAIIIIALFGLVLLFPKLLVYFELLASKLVNKTQKPGAKKRDGLIGGFIVGTSLGLIWTPCVGPILASVIALSISGQVSGNSFFIVLAYAIGTAIPMFAILYGGKKLISKVPGLLKNLPKIQKGFGVLMIIMSIVLFLNLERSFQTYILEKFPSYGTKLTQIENNKLVQEKLQTKTPMQSNIVAPALTGTGDWFNSEPLTLEELKGKIVIIDFWTYSCINCIRTLPYLEALHQKYKDQGLVLIGVHTPEFEFEKNSANLAKAIKDFGLTYPIVQDNDFATWRAYQNRYWPAKYIIDQNGKIVYTHFGEGKYEETEQVVQSLLQKAGYNPDTTTTTSLKIDKNSGNTSPETYFNSKRIKNFASPEKITANKFNQYSIPETLELNQFAFQGNWNITEENSTPQKNSKLKINFQGKDIYLVARAKKDGVAGKIEIKLNGKKYYNAETDGRNGILTVNDNKLYHLISLPKSRKQTLELEFLDENLEIYTFTFG